MFPIHDQISVATRNHLESQLALFTQLSNKSLESLEKLLSLNITATKANLEESAAQVRELCAAQNPQELLALSISQTQPGIEKALAYGRHLSTIGTGAREELVKAAETQWADGNRKVAKMIEDASRKAPAGAAGVADLMKTAIENANKGYEQFARTSQQAAQAMEANLNATISQMATAK
jgi:phasin family protein